MNHQSCVYDNVFEVKHLEQQGVDPKPETII
jgi:hypothetical protein